MLKDIIHLITAAGNQLMQPGSDRSYLLGQDRRQFSMLFDHLDADKDNKLNAAELRSLFSQLFGDPVSTEHLLHFENRYLLQYGEEGGLSKSKFFAILEDYEESYGYNINDDIFEFYNHFVGEDSVRIEHKQFCQAISVMLPLASRKEMAYLTSRLSNVAKAGGEITYEIFRNVIYDIFNINTNLKASSSGQSTVDEVSAVKHPFYRDMLSQRVSSYSADSRDAKMLQDLLDKLKAEMGVSLSVQNVEAPVKSDEENDD